MESISLVNTGLCRHLSLSLFFSLVPELDYVGEMPVIDTHVVVGTQEGNKGLGRRRSPWQPVELMVSHGCTVFPWACTLQWNLLTGVRLMGFQCTVGGSSHECMHGVGGHTLGLE